MPLPSLAADIPLDQAGRTGGPTPGAAPPLSFLDKVRLGNKQAYAEANWGSNQHSYESEAYSEIRTALEQRGYKLPARNFAILGPQADDEADFYSVGYHPSRPWLAGPGAEARYDAFWKAFNDERSRDPNFLPGYKDVHDFGTLLDHVRSKRTADAEDVSRQAPDGLGFGGFIGGLGRAATDPLSYLPIGGPEAEGVSIGGRILRQAFTGAAINAGVTVATEPLVRMDAANLGVQRTTGDFLTDLLTSTAFGGGLGAGVEGARVGIEALRKPAPAPEAEAPHPQTGTPFDSFDAKVAKAFAEIVPEEQRTPDEQAAIHAITRDAEVKAQSPFVPGPAGDDAHATALDRGMAALHGAPAAPRTVKPVARERIAAPEDVEGTRMPSRELLKAKLHRAEAPGADDFNEASGATGPYQFVASTWVSLFKRRYPNDKRSFNEIAALRRDPHLNDVLINDLIAENAAALRHAKLEESAGNLYLAHVLGHDRAVTVLRAAADAKLGDLLPHGYFKGNPFKPTDTSASLIHWAYGKMGEKGLPEHIAAAPDAPAGAAAIEAAADPAAPIPTGRFDVEALYGDVGMADRPVLRPELFDSPEAHAAAQLRFERERDMADGYAPVMSRAEAFSPDEHVAAVRSYQGKVTPEAMGEALGLTPGELRQVVGRMQAIDPNSPYMMARGRPPKYDSMGNVVREGTEAGRIIRRPKLPVSDKPATMLEYLTRERGLADVGGDLRHMGGEDWHRQAPFRRKLIDNEDGQSLDDAFQAAIDAGYFPEHMANAENYDQLPDLQDFRDAIDAELRGNPRYAVEDYAAAHDAARQARFAPEEDQPVETAAQRAERLFERTGHNQEAIGEAAGRRGIVLTDDAMVIHASDLIGAGMAPDEALDHAALDATYRHLDDAARETGDGSYAISADERFADDGFAEQRGSDLGSGGEAEPGGGGPEGVAAAAEEARNRLAQSAHDPERGEFGDPVGKAAEAQADSTIHDLEMQGRAPEGEAAPAPDDTTYRLDEDGGESDVAGILDEIEQAQKAAAEMRNCLKPKGGDA